jgi:Na+/H+ antiporter NhaD/arsenite permease-like protein
MMDELELLKRDWQKKDAELPKLSYTEIHKMIWKKSSSIVKWILIISILEFTLPHLLYLLPSMQEGMEVYKNIGVSKYLFGVSIISYAVVFYFIFQFYKRFKEISVLDNSKNLMRKIIRTRKTVKHYVIFSLSMIMVTVLIMVVGVYLNENISNAFPDLKDSLENISEDKLRITLMLSIGIFGILLTLFMGGVYFLLYGLLLRKLKKNYGELRQLEI